MHLELLSPRSAAAQRSAIAGGCCIRVWLLSPLPRSALARHATSRLSQEQPQQRQARREARASRGGSTERHEQREHPPCDRASLVLALRVAVCTVPLAAAGVLRRSLLLRLCLSSLLLHRPASSPPSLARSLRCPLPWPRRRAAASVAVWSRDCSAATASCTRTAWSVRAIDLCDKPICNQLCSMCSIASMRELEEQQLQHPLPPAATAVPRSTPRLLPPLTTTLTSICSCRSRSVCWTTSQTLHQHCRSKEANSTSSRSRRLEHQRRPLLQRREQERARLRAPRRQEEARRLVQCHRPVSIPPTVAAA